MLAAEALTHFVNANAVGTADAYDRLWELEQEIERHWKKNPGMRTGTENIIVAATNVIREVNNGGFDQFFRNSSKRWAFFAGDAFLHIGRRDAAKLTRKAVRAIRLPKDLAEMFAGVGPTFDMLDQMMRKPDIRRDEIFDECDIAFQSLTGLAASVLAYAEKHPGGLLRKS
jgi:hypothetical protein